MEQQYTQEIAWLEMDSSKTFFLSLEKDREVVIGGTIPKSGADVSFTVVRARLQIYIYR